jgi:hypothetical protein
VRTHSGSPASHRDNDFHSVSQDNSPKKDFTIILPNEHEHGLCSRRLYGFANSTILNHALCQFLPVRVFHLLFDRSHKS